MTELAKLLTKLEKQKSLLKKSYKVKSIDIFRSYSKGKQTQKSDLYILVKFSKPIGLLDYVTLEEELSKHTGKKVDLVMKAALKPKIGKRILSEVIYVK
jgi:predicted nucleotidyltransferase